MNTFLQIFLLVDMVIIGAVVTVAVRHWYAHTHPEEHDHPPTDHDHSKPATAAAQGGHLPPAVREHLLEVAQAQFEKTLTKATADLEKDLESSATHIKQLLDTHGAEIIGRELQHYKTRLGELEQETEASVKTLDKRLDEHEADLKTKLAEEFAAEKQRLIGQIDTKLADAVSSFLIETLQHNVDLGAQSAYLVSVLEEHKAELIKEVEDGSVNSTS